jgi:hypothetical protein
VVDVDARMEWRQLATAYESAQVVRLEPEVDHLPARDDPGLVVERSRESFHVPTIPAGPTTAPPAVGRLWRTASWSS